MIFRSQQRQISSGEEGGGEREPVLHFASQEKRNCLMNQPNPRDQCITCRNVSVMLGWQAGGSLPHLNLRADSLLKFYSLQTLSKAPFMYIFLLVSCNRPRHYYFHWELCIPESSELCPASPFVLPAARTARET